MFQQETDHYTTILKRVIEDLQEDQAKLQKELDTISGNEEWNIMSFEEDANWGHLRHMVDEMVEKGDAIVLLKETS